MSWELDLEKVKELMAALEASNLTRLELKIGEAEVVLSREGPQMMAAPPAPVHVAPTPQAAPAASPAPAAEESGNFITSPMVGTFYQAPSPGDPVFVKVGDRVSPDTVIGIVEAMKVMNEIKAGVSGTVQKILVDNGDPVEFGAKLYEIA